MKTYHILNGDCLLDQLDFIEGEKYVLRECFIDGNIGGNNIDEILTNRVSFFRDAMDTSEEKYRSLFVSELDKIKSITPEGVIHLWFEYDLFCQANLWFTVYFLMHHVPDATYYFISPDNDTWSGFGADDDSALGRACGNRKFLDTNAKSKLYDMWVAYEASDWSVMQRLASELQDTIPKIEEVVQAHIDRFPTDKNHGRPEQALRSIIDEVGTSDFGQIFKAFSATQGIYGFGDLQVKRMMDKVIGIN